MLMGGEGVAEAALMAGDFSDLSNCFHNVSKTIFLRDIISMKFLVLNAKTLCYHINIEKIMLLKMLTNSWKCERPQPCRDNIPFFFENHIGQLP